MKKVLTILIFVLLTSLSFGQEVASSDMDLKLDNENKVEQPAVKKASLSSELKAKVLKVNKKKSKDIISIKAYRKSLQIKVKTVKLC